ncbi:glycosyltransferase, partial [Enterococcus faecium]|nr:glycosyltransferase [Enterococcus faecium]
MRLMVSGGGTGGHIYPALALIKQVKQSEPDSQILYVGTSKGLESKIVPDSGIDFKTINIQGFKRSLSLENFKTIGLFLSSVVKARKMVKEFKPDVVLGTGGYVSGAVVFAASMMGVPTVIHEQNSVVGVTNKFLSKFVKKIAI